MVAGGSLGEAAGFLGIASTGTTWLGKSGIYTGVGHVHTGARQQPDPCGFKTALTVLARELDDPATPLVNYQHRRQALQDWYIDKDTEVQQAWRSGQLSHTWGLMQRSQAGSHDTTLKAELNDIAALLARTIDRTTHSSR